jgi:hypothetical protein
LAAPSRTSLFADSGENADPSSPRERLQDLDIQAEKKKRKKKTTINMAGKKAAVENSKKVAGNARKAEANARKTANEEVKKEQAEAEEWSKGAKSGAKK